VLAVTGTGSSIAEARDRAYHAVSTISFEGMHFRRDIAAHAAAEQEAVR
jgi:phosphoribosylamine--glycine ligase